MSRERSTRQPLADKVHDILLEEFLAGTRAPGEPLNIAVLTRELDVSQTPLREALARLEHTGLVRREALKGYQVAPLPTDDERRQLLEARIVLEPAIAAGAARRSSADLLRELERTTAVLEVAARQRRDDSAAVREWQVADERFHALLAERCGNVHLAAAFAALSGQMQRARFAAARSPLDPGPSAAEHRRILDAVTDDDPRRAETAMREHLTAVLGRSGL